MSTAVFLRYAEAEIRRHYRDTAYRTYVTDALRVITENTARFAGGTYLRTRFADTGKEDARGAEEIVAEIRRKLRE